MQVQSIRYTFAPEEANRAAEILEELRDLSIREPGVVSFRVARVKNEPNVFLLWEEYRDEEALAEHAGTEHFKRLVVDGTRRLAKERVGESALSLP